MTGSTLLIAHRGGAKLAPENTMRAFHQASKDWASDMIELDVRATADGQCVVIHDETVDRTTDGTGPVAGLTLAELQSLDAGYRFTRDGGRTHPFRGQDIRVPTIDQVLTELPRMRFTVEVKAGAAQGPLFASIQRHDATHRVIAAGIHDRDRSMFGEYEGALSASSEQITRFYIAHKARLGRLWGVPADVVQVPEYDRGRRVVSERFIRDLHAQGIEVHVWTVDDPSDMHRLLDWGVDGILSDRPDLLARVLTQREGRPEPAALADR